MNRQLVFGLVLCIGAAAPCTAQDATKAEVEKVTLRRNAEDDLEAVIALKEAVPDGLKKGTVRLLFIVDGAGLKPKTVTDVPAAGSIALRAGNGWSLSGGSLTNKGKPAGFLVDLGPLREWPMPDAKTIAVPLDSTTLFEGMPARLEREKGELFVAFVEYAKDGNTMVAVSNTASVKVSDKDLPAKKQK